MLSRYESVRISARRRTISRISGVVKTLLLAGLVVAVIFADRLSVSQVSKKWEECKEAAPLIRFLIYISGRVSYSDDCTVSPLIKHWLSGPFGEF